MASRDPEKTTNDQSTLREDEKSVPTYDTASLDSDNLPDKDVQHGVQAAEAVTTIWGKKSLVLAYIMFVLMFRLLFQN